VSGGCIGFWAGSISSSEVLKVSRARCRVSQPEYRSTSSRRGKTPADCFGPSKFKWDSWESTPWRHRRRPVRWGTADRLPRTAESWVAKLKGRRWTSKARMRPVLVWPLKEFFNYRLRDKLYSIGYFRKQRAVGFREPDLKTFLIVCNTFRRCCRAFNL